MFGVFGSFLSYYFCHLQTQFLDRMTMDRVVHQARSALTEINKNTAQQFSTCTRPYFPLQLYFVRGLVVLYSYFLEKERK